ncbi:MAG: TatD family deoxyribonuclease, partial [Candidatus Zixiibacteriota bacterium]
MIDSHCHLDFPQFNGIREDCLREAQQAGVHTIINIGTDIPTSEKSVALAKQHDMVFAAVGVHPHDAGTLDDAVIDRLRALAAESKVKAIGEIGLDYYRDLSPRPVQKQALHRQLALAVETGLPVVIHTREAFEDTLAIVSEYASDLPGGVFHCFPGGRDDAERVFALGFVISVGGV